MATTVTIALQTRAVGTFTVGPSVVPVGTSLALLTLNRTVGGASLDSRPVTTTLDLEVAQSTDGGVTWDVICTAHTTGGVFIDPEVGTLTATTIQCPLPQPDLANRQARARVTIAGSSVSFSGSLVLS